jgi:hypothetical protein
MKICELRVDSSPPRLYHRSRRWWETLCQRTGNPSCHIGTYWQLWGGIGRLHVIMVSQQLGLYRVFPARRI